MSDVNYKRWHVCGMTLWRWRQEGRLRSFKIGQNNLTPAEVVEEIERERRKILEQQLTDMTDEDKK